MIILYNRPVDEEGLDYLIDKINQIPCGYNEDVKLFLNSVGGNPDIVSAFKHLLEENWIKIVAFEQVDSAALDILWATQVPRVVLEDTIGTYHFAQRLGGTLNRNFKPVLSTRDEFSKNNTEAFDKG